MKKIIIFITCVVVSITMRAHDFEVDGIYYNITSASNLEVEVTHWSSYSEAYGSSNSTPYSGDIIIPEKVNYNNREYTVIGIGTCAFGAGTYSYGVGSTGFSGGTQVTSVMLPNTIRYINNAAFCGCWKLTELSLSSELQEIKNYAFAGTAIKNIYIPDKVTNIGPRAFWRCSQIEFAVLEKNVKSLGYYVDGQGTGRYDGCFDECSNLKEMFYLGEKIPYYTSKAFQSCHSSLEHYLVRNYISFDANTFTYTGVAPETTWNNGLRQLNCDLEFPELPKEAGEYEVICTAKYSGFTNFLCDIPYKYTINKAPLSISVNDASKIYGDSNPTFNAEFSGFVNKEDKSVLSKCELSTTATTSSDAGTYPIQVSAETKNYEITATNGTLTVNKAPLTATVINTDKVYGDENPTFTVDYSGLKNNDKDPQPTKSLKFTTEANKQSSVGTYSVTANGGEFKNYEITKYVAGTLTVKKAPLSITCNDATKVYGDVNPTFSFTYSGLKNNDTEDNAFVLKPSVDTEITKRTAVGEYDIIGSNGAATNYSLKYVKGKLTITKAPLIITANDASREYGNANPMFTFIYGGFKNDETEEVLSSQPIATSVGRTSDVGEYNIVSDGATASNYAISYGIGKLTIAKAPLDVKVKDASRQYGEGNPEFTLTYTGLKNDDDKSCISTQPTVTTDATKDSPVGSYSLVASGGFAKNYDFKKYTSGTLTIGKAELTVTATNLQMTYGDALPSLTYTCSGLKNKDTNVSAFTRVPSLSCDATSTSNCGEYPIQICNGESDNYVISYNNGIMNVGKRELVTTVGNYTRPYNTDNPSFSLNYSGFVNGDDVSKITTKPTVSCDATKISDTGDYVISLYGGNAQNYSFAFVDGKLTIEKAEQEITWDEIYENVEVGSQIELTATASSGLEIEYSVSDESIAKLYTAGKNRTFLDCLKDGVIIVKAKQNGNNNYYSSPIFSKKIVVKTKTGIHGILNNDECDPNNKMYNINGQRVKSSSKGIIIVNGKKYFNR